MKDQSIPKCFVNILFIVAILFATVPVHAAELADRIVAIVNDDCITLSELNEAIKPYLKNVDEGGYPPDVARTMRFDVRKKVMNGLIDQKLTDRESERLGITVDKEEVDQYFERTKNENFMTEEDLRKALAVQGFTWEGYREQVKQQIIRVKLINFEVKSKIAVTEDDIKDHYEKHKGDYAGTKQYHLETIVARVLPGATDEEISATREQIDSIEMALKTGAEGAFDDVSQRFSEEGLTVTSSDLGVFAIDELSETIRDMVGQMEAGESTPVLEVPQGFQILHVKEITKTPGKTLEEVTPEIQEKLFQAFVEEKYEKFLEKLRKRSYIKIIQ